MMQSFEWNTISKVGNPEVPCEDYLVVVFIKEEGEPGFYYVDTATYDPGYGNTSHDWVLNIDDDVNIFRAVTHWANIPSLPKDLPLL